MEFFDAFFGYNCQAAAHTFYPDALWRNREKVPLDKKTYSHDLIMDAAFAFIRANKDRPFFCYLSVTIPHASMHAPQALHEKYRKQFPQFEAVTGKYAGPEVVNPVAAFPAMVEHLDNGVGRLSALLKELGLNDNTLVIFTSDNGPHKEGGHDPEFWDSNGPLKGIKRDLYEGGIRVPFIARWPAVIKPGGTTGQTTAFWDMLPTFCELAEVPPPAGLDGLSILPTFKGLTQPQHDYLYWEFTERGGSQALRMGDYKAVRLKVAKAPDAPVELYDLASDLGETNNIATQHPGLVRKIEALFQAARTDSETFPLFKK
jgi:arylsulfatase A-like enzyme